MNKLFYKYGKPKFTRASDVRFKLHSSWQSIVTMKQDNLSDTLIKASMMMDFESKASSAIAQEKRHPFYKSDYAKGGLIEVGAVYLVGENDGYNR